MGHEAIVRETVPLGSNQTAGLNSTRCFRSFNRCGVVLSDFLNLTCERRRLSNQERRLSEKMSALVAPRLPLTSRSLLGLLRRPERL